MRDKYEKPEIEVVEIIQNVLLNSECTAGDFCSAADRCRCIYWSCSSGDVCPPQVVPCTNDSCDGCGCT